MEEAKTTFSHSFELLPDTMQLDFLQDAIAALEEKYHDVNSRYYGKRKGKLCQKK
jgi:hypothetical protein